MERLNGRGQWFDSGLHQSTAPSLWTWRAHGNCSMADPLADRSTPGAASACGCSVVGQACESTLPADLSTAAGLSAPALCCHGSGGYSEMSIGDWRLNDCCRLPTVGFVD